MGTPRFLSPELTFGNLKQKNCTFYQAADIWALGVSLYELLTLKKFNLLYTYMI